MSFLDTVVRAKSYLEAQGRVSLRALQREFDLSDDALEELVEELADVQEVAAREGKVLSWIGNARTEPTVRGPEARAMPEAAPESATASQASDAERRQLSVLFCDLVDSTRLAAGMDAEDWREVVRGYQQAAAAVVERYAGHIAQYLGDGLLIYFGWPRAHEDDAERAVRAGLGIVDAVALGNDALAAKHSIELAVRVGIHTGPVVVGEMGGGSSREMLAMGDTTNVAARIQGEAARDTVVFSSATLRLVSGIFVIEELGARLLKGARELHLHRALRPSGMRSRLDVAAATGLTPLVGRDQELGLLADRFAQVAEGRGQAVLVSGEPGIGKSRLVQAFRERIAERAHTWLECRFSPYTQDSPLFPVLELQRRVLGLGVEVPTEVRVDRLEAGLEQAGFDPARAMPLMAAFHGFPLPGRYEEPVLSPESRRKETLGLLVEWLLRLGRLQPLVLLMEDLHWVDPSTQELLGQTLEQIPREQLLLLATHRPDFEPPWGAKSHLTPMLLARLTRPQLGNLVRKAARGRELPDTWVEEIIRRSDGVPLFAEEITKTVLETHPELLGAGAPLPALHIPETLQDSLMARLDALGPVKELAQVGSVLGREFSYALLREVSPMNEAELQVALRSAVREELFYQRGTPPAATYLFKHALIQDAAYGSLLRSRRVELHAAIVAVLERAFPEIAESQPELLAHHHTEAGQVRPAIDQWREAARRSLRRSANKEAIAHLGRALDLLAAAPHSPERDREELDLQTELGSATMMSQGWGSPDGARCYARARELCLAVGDERELFPILWGFWLIHQTRSELAEWRKTAAELLAIAERHRDPAMLVEAHHASWGNPCLGDFAFQLEHVERGLSLYDPAEHSRLAPQYGGHDAGVCGHCHRGVALFATGYPERAGESIAAALALADEIAHPQSRVHALVMSAWLPAFRSEWREAFRAADAAMALASELGVPTWIAMAAAIRGWALVALGEPADGLAEIRRSVESGAHAFLATHQAFYAEALHLAGASDEALATLDDALPRMEASGQGLWRANAMALKGDLLLARGREADAEVWYRNAIERARAQSAKLWELRATTRLARLWQLHGKTTTARDLLAPLYGWFTEGLDTADLKAAKALLEELA
jgi:class 3 adenylate cyclase/tetratricopeptide (TPR) repeat protein